MLKIQYQNQILDADLRFILWFRLIKDYSYKKKQFMFLKIRILILTRLLSDSFITQVFNWKFIACLFYLINDIIKCNYYNMLWSI